jgi:hypothetical protein
MISNNVACAREKDRREEVLSTSSGGEDGCVQHARVQQGAIYDDYY